MSGKRQKTGQAWLFDEAGEACAVAATGTETSMTRGEPESPAGNRRWMEEVCERENLREAWKRVRANQGSPGIDGMTVDELLGYLKEHGPELREQLLNSREPISRAR